MKFSVIIVSLNAGDELKHTIQSVLKQTYKDFEIVLKDGGSTDGSLNYLPKDSRIRTVIAKDTSIYDAMNQAIQEAKGEFFLFMNCGDYFYDESVLAKCTKEMVSHKADIYYGDLYRRVQKVIDVSPGEITDFVCYRNIPCHQACIYHRNMFAKRGYDLNYPVRADYEHFLWCKYEAGAMFYHLPFVIASYEGNGFSDSAENQKRAATEHTVITRRYLKNKQWRYRLAMILTLQPLRKKIAEHPKWSKRYQAVKSFLYGRR